MKTISLKLDEELHDQLERAAEQIGTSKSDIVREAVKEYIKAKPQVMPGSCLDLFGNLIGRFDGPEDLSYDEEHMKDFGK